MGCGCSSSFSGKAKSKKASFVGKKKVDKAKLKNRFNSFMGKSTKVDMRKHNIPMEDFSAYNTSAKSNYSGSISQSGFGIDKMNINRNDLNVEF